MSHVTDLANAEADAAEAEAAEDDAADLEDDADLEPDREPSANAAIEKALAAMEKENVRHGKRVAEIMGDDFALVHVCPGCVDFAAGFTLTPPDEQPPLLSGEQFERCSTCNGYGAVLTGALTDHGRTQTCQTCSGQGYVTKAVAPPVALAAVPAVPDAVAAAANLLRTQGWMAIEPPQPAPQAV